jgi:chromosome segregation ATPase
MNQSTPYQNHRPTLSLSNNNAENHVPSRSAMPLSPKTTNALSSDKDTIFQLQLEIQTLKQRLSVTSSTGKNELMELVQEKESVIQAKSRQVSLLTEKFHKISKAFTGMEAEVVKLRDSKNDLEEENNKLKRHLNIREKEVNSLVLRCTSQEEKIMRNKDSKVLERQLGEVKKQLHESEEKLEQMQLLEKQLAMTQKEKEEIMQQLEALSSDKENLDRHLHQTKEDLQRMINDKDDVLVTMRKELAKIKELKEEQDHENIKLTSLMMEKEKELSDAIREITVLNEENAKYNEDITRLNAEVTSLENEVTLLKKNADHLSKNNQESSGLIAQLKMQVEEKEKVCFVVACQIIIV